MPRYYFDASEDGSFVRDDEGVELANTRAASDAAAKALGEMALDVRPGALRRDLQIEVRDAERVLLVATLMLEIARRA
jgi:hypothetical protein